MSRTPEIYFWWGLIKLERLVCEELLGVVLAWDKAIIGIEYTGIIGEMLDFWTLIKMTKLILLGENTMLKKLACGFLIFIALVMLVVCIFLHQQNNKKAEEQQKRNLKLQQEVELYSDEIQKISADLKEKKNQLPPKILPEVVVGFTMYSQEDLALIQEYLEMVREVEECYPLIEISLDIAVEEKLQWLRDSNMSGYDVLLKVDCYNENTWNDIDDVKDALKKHGFMGDVISLVKAEDKSLEFLADLKKYGNVGFIYDDGGYVSGLAETKTPYLSYMHIIEKEKAMAIMPDFLRTEYATVLMMDVSEMEWSEVDYMLTWIYSNMSEGRLRIGLAEETINKQEHIEDARCLYENVLIEYEEYCAEQQKKIEELKILIQEKYAMTY